MSLNNHDVAKIAHLARIKVPQSEQEELAKALDKIVAFVAQLDTVDVEGVAPMTTPIKMDLHLRDDKVLLENTVEDILKNAPETHMNFFTVPKVIE